MVTGCSGGAMGQLLGSAREQEYELSSFARRTAEGAVPTRADMDLFAIFCRGRIGFENGHVFHSNTTMGHALQPGVRFVIEILRQVLGGGINSRKRFDVIDHLVIEAFDD